MIRTFFVKPEEIIEERDRARSPNIDLVDLAGCRIKRLAWKYLWWKPEENTYGIDIGELRNMKCYPCSSLGEAITFYNLIDAGE